MIGVASDDDACGAAGRGRATAATLTAPAFLGGGAGSITAATVRRVVARHDAGAVAIDGAARAVDHALASRAAQAGPTSVAAAAAIGRIRADGRAGIAAADLPRSARTLTADACLCGFALTSAGTTVEGISTELDACRAAFVEAGRARASPLAAALRSGTGIAARPAVQIARIERDAVRSTQVFFDPARDEIGAAFHDRRVSTGRALPPSLPPGLLRPTVTDRGRGLSLRTRSKVRLPRAERTGCARSNDAKSPSCRSLSHSKRQRLWRLHVESKALQADRPACRSRTARCALRSAS